MDMNATQPIPLSHEANAMSDLGRKLWKAARRVTELEYEVQCLRKQRRQLATLLQEMLNEKDKDMV